MRAVVSDGTGAVRLSERPRPHLRGDHDLVVELEAAGMNGADVLQARGRYPAPAGVPADILGLEFVGRVVEAGAGVDTVDVGDDVMGLVGGGAFADFITVDAAHVIPRPATVDVLSAAGFVEAFATAHDALVTQGGLDVGQRVLVHGGAGGVGTAAIQLAVVAGTEVVTTCRTDRHHERLTDFGARIAPEDSFASAGPFDIVLELVGAGHLKQNLASLARGGTIVLVGAGAGATDSLNLVQVMSKNAHITGSTIRARSHAEKSRLLDLLRRRVLPLLAAGLVTVPVHDTFALSDAPLAFAEFAKAGKFGKIILTA